MGKKRRKKKKKKKKKKNSTPRKRWNKYSGRWQKRKSDEKTARTTSRPKKSTTRMIRTARIPKLNSNGAITTTTKTRTNNVSPIHRDHCFMLYKRSYSLSL